MCVRRRRGSLLRRGGDRCGGCFPAGADLFLDSGGLACALAQVIELGTADMSAPLNRYLLDARRMDKENALYADALKNAAHGQSRVYAAAMSLDDDPFVALRPLLTAFPDFDEDFDRIADVDARQIFLQKRGFDLLN